MDFLHFYYLTNMGDLEDIIPAFKNQSRTEMNCNGFIMDIQDDLHVSHNTFNIYNLMLRVHKAYHM